VNYGAPIRPTRPRRHKAEDRGHDLYETPRVAVESLMQVEPLPPRIWEPACGRGAIAVPLRDYGHKVWASDLIDYKWGGQDEAAADFTADQAATPPWIPGAIVTNPPFSLAQDFIELALRRAEKVVMLMRLAVLESVRRTNVLENAPLARVWVYRERLPMMHRDGWTGPRAASDTAMAWFVWDWSYEGEPVIRRLSWRDTPTARADQTAAPRPAAGRRQREITPPPWVRSARAAGAAGGDGQGGADQGGGVVA
jgi:hypothetical protein